MRNHGLNETYLILLFGVIFVLYILTFLLSDANASQDPNLTPPKQTESVKLPPNYIPGTTIEPNYLTPEDLERFKYIETHLDKFDEDINHRTLHFCGDDGPSSAKFPDYGYCRDNKIFILLEDKDSSGKIVKYREVELKVGKYKKEDTGLQCTFVYSGDPCHVYIIGENK